MENHRDKTNVISRAVLVALISCASHSGGDPFPPNPFNSGPSSSDSPPVFTFPTPPPVPQGQPSEYEKCYGIAGKDENDCAYASFDGEPNSCAGTAKACDPGAWRWVPKGTCGRIVVGTRDDGTILYGTLQPSMDRGYPVQCSPHNPAKLKSKDYGL
ncbi:MAG: DUF2282 domain-containing protein [Alphaproteobacteria bacterium]